MLNFDFLQKSMGIAISIAFCEWFFKQNFSCYALLTDQISYLIPFISLDIGQ